MRPSYYIDGLFRQSNAADARSYLGLSAAGVNFISAGTESDAGGIVFANSNGVTFGMSNSTVTASVAAGGGGLTNIKLSAGTKSDLRSDVTFSNSNGVSFGLNAAGVITATVQTNYLTTAMQSNAATISNVKFSAGTKSDLRSDITFNNSNGVSFGLDAAGVITATVKTDYLTTAMPSNAATISNVLFSAGTLSSLRSDITFANSNGVTFGLATNGVITASVATAAAGNSVNFSAGTTSNNLASVVFSNSNGVTFGLNGSTITASFSQASAAGTTLSYFCQPPQAFQGFSSYAPASTAAFCFDPFVMPLAGSFDFLRFIVAATNVTTQYGTSNAATSYSGSRETSVYLGIYSLGTGASSDSLFSVWTSSGGLSMAISIDETGSQYTRNMTVQYPQSNGYQTLTLSSAISSSSIALNETRSNLNVLAGTAAMDYPASLSLSPGNYWFMFGTATARTSQGDSRISNANIGLTYQFMPQLSRVREFFQTDLVGVAFIAGTTQVVPFTPPDSIATSGIVTNAITDGDPKIYWQGIRHA